MPPPRDDFGASGRRGMPPQYPIPALFSWSIVLSPLFDIPGMLIAAMVALAGIMGTGS